MADPTGIKAPAYWLSLKPRAILTGIPHQLSRRFQQILLSLKGLAHALFGSAGITSFPTVPCSSLTLVAPGNIYLNVCLVFY
jgi:hypothetical protein